MAAEIRAESAGRRIAMWSKCHLYWTGMNGSGNTGRTRACCHPSCCASAFLIWRPPRSSPGRRIAMWSKCHLYWTGMNGSGNTRRKCGQAHRYVVEMPPVLDRDEWQRKYGQNPSLLPPILLRKCLPDLAAAEIKSGQAHRYVVEMP